MDLKRKAELAWSAAMMKWQDHDGYVAIIEQALKQVREETLDQCMGIAQRHGCGPKNGSLGSLEADLIQDEIQELKEKG